MNPPTLRTFNYDRDTLSGRAFSDSVDLAKRLAVIDPMEESNILPQRASQDR